eukprot:1159447-Pelagomonas_calceolata.AAC.7
MLLPVVMLLAAILVVAMMILMVMARLLEQAAQICLLLMRVWVAQAWSLCGRVSRGGGSDTGVGADGMLVGTDGLSAVGTGDMRGVWICGSRDGERREYKACKVTPANRGQGGARVGLLGHIHEQESDACVHVCVDLSTLRSTGTASASQHFHAQTSVSDWGVYTCKALPLRCKAMGLPASLSTFAYRNK